MPGWAVSKDVWANYWLELFEKRESIVETLSTHCCQAHPPVRYVDWNNCLSHGGQQVDTNKLTFQGFWTRSCGWLKCPEEFWSSWKSSRVGSLACFNWNIWSACRKFKQVWAERWEAFYLPAQLTENAHNYSSCLELAVVLKPISPPESHYHKLGLW